MSESDWLTSDDPVKMLASLGVRGPDKADGAAPVGRASARKIRLFACALFRLLVAHGTRMSPNNHATIGRVEARPDRPPPADPAGPNMGWAAPLRGDLSTGIMNILGIPCLVKSGPGTVPRALQADLLREVFASPFPRQAAIHQAVLAWGDGQVVRLAQAAYRHCHRPTGRLERTRLAILADALEETGCEADIIGHLRSPGPHVRGCWAVDLVLGRE